MASKCGVVRDGKGLSILLSEIDALEKAHPEARALIAARLIAEAAFDREESRGGHFRSDFPDPSETPKRTFKARRDVRATEMEPA